MMWKRPGKSSVTVIDGVKVTIKAMTQEERLDYAYKISSLSIQKNPEDITSDDLKINIDQLVCLIAGQIEKIEMEGFDGTVIELLKWQSHKLLLKISDIIMSGADMTEAEEKN